MHIFLFVPEESPYHRAFEESTNKFEQRFEFGKVPSAYNDGKTSGANGRLGLLFSTTVLEAPSKASCSGQYLLDNGEGHEQHGDDVHVCWFILPKAELPSKDVERKSYLVVVARGENEFGRFISAGKVEQIDGSNYLLTLARRYVTDKDYRWGGTSDIPQNTVQALVDQQLEATPWALLRTKPARKRRAKDQNAPRKRNRAAPSSPDSDKGQKKTR
uniref:Uncharacterized protein n=1 Tax=Lotharella oceanica TaxID=641309 RepID=A0A7S2TKN8_9EUKA|mmetsp:Transcript_15999/g.30363  ORF Transcript_15999/g.30363 Transcript_15999/m.30363 type:complete len:216 (+) Transcript_15999:150-797(+)